MRAGATDPRAGANAGGTSSAANAVAGVLGVLLIAMLDWVTGIEVSFSIFYLAPLVWVAWFEGRRLGLAVALLAAAAWYAADRLGGQSYTHDLIPVWNALVRLGFFVLAVEASHRLRVAMSEAERLARTDALTGLCNLRAFRDAMNGEINRSQRYHRAFSVAYVDVDDFKLVNDRLGHDVGDRVLEEVSRVLQANLRSVDLPARMGGDEFAILLPETDADQARSLIDKLHRLLGSVATRNRWPISFSVGVASFATPPESLERVIRCADELMYQVKHSGKAAIRVQTF
jgi:diguanylate cyclase (GGDEF)-like protein